MTKTITSVQNPFIKQLLNLKDKSRTRKKTGLFVIEGKRELSLAIKGKYTIETLYYYPDLFSESEAKSLSLYNIDVIEINKTVYEKIAHRGTTEGIIAVARCKDFKLDKIKFRDNTPLILVCEATEKPGNIGALLRTADAANVDAILIANPKTDLFNPNTIRSSVGCIFTNQIGCGSSAEIIEFLNKNKIEIYAAALQNAVPYTTPKFHNSSAIVVGSEDNGLDTIWIKAAKKVIKIPMEGAIDSMNVSVAAGIIVFEAKRQRKLI